MFLCWRSTISTAAALAFMFHMGVQPGYLLALHEPPWISLVVGLHLIGCFGLLSTCSRRPRPMVHAIPRIVLVAQRSSLVYCLVTVYPDVMCVVV
ncbi:hypothetical protein BC827DRAFT_1214886 [Russula dissimulans]|nr:hypothetical protein BC827DRAFT_1214886 [Russula dissimulans]